MDNQQDLFTRANKLTDDIGGTLGHIINTMAGLSERSIAAGVLLLSTIPEFYGLVDATGNRAVAVAAALISLALVKTALGTTCKNFRGIPYNHFWLIYAAVLGAELAFIIGAGQHLGVGLIVFSFGGAVCSVEIARVIKQEATQAAATEHQRQKDAIRTKSFEAREAARTAAYVAKHAPQPRPPRNTPANGGTDKATITAAAAAVGGEKGRQTRIGKAAARQETLYESLIRDYPGVEIRDLSWAELGRKMSVSANTAKRDVAALRDAGRINGRVPSKK